MKINQQRLLNRFLDYVQIETTADPESSTYPSSSGQLKLGKLLVEQLQKLTIADAHQDENGLIWGTIAATVSGPAPTILLNAHLDTSPDASGKNVRPKVIESYQGGDIPLEKNNLAIRVEDTPALSGLSGKTLITTDGSTLLGGDDKAGVAIIMELAAHLIGNPHLPHGPVRILFTCDEEIGAGTKKIDLADTHGAVVGYTLDGGGAGTIDGETFSADQAVIQFIGKNIHPSIGKGRMVNALRAASYFVDQLPRTELAPEVTDHRQGFLHPHEIRGDVASATVKILLRDFVTEKLSEYAGRLRKLAQATEEEFPGLVASVEIQRQYRNMADGMVKQPLAIELPVKAYQTLGRPYKVDIVRGGTDGSQLTEMGLPTPNLSSGQHNLHSPLEFACLDQMVEAVEHLVVLLDLWQAHGRS